MDIQWTCTTCIYLYIYIYICIYCITCIVSSLFDLLEACNRNVQCSTLITLPSAWPKKRPSTLGDGCYTKTMQLRKSGSTHTHLVEALRRSLNPSQFHNRSFIMYYSISGQLLRYSQSCLWRFASVHWMRLLLQWLSLKQVNQLSPMLMMLASNSWNACMLKFQRKPLPENPSDQWTCPCLQIFDTAALAELDECLQTCSTASAHIQDIGKKIYRLFRKEVVSKGTPNLMRIILSIDGHVYCKLSSSFGQTETKPWKLCLPAGFC